MNRLNRLFIALAIGFSPIGAQLSHADTPSSMGASSRLAESAFKSATHISQNYSYEGLYELKERRGPITKSDSGFGLTRNVVDEAVHTFNGFPRALANEGASGTLMTQSEALQKANTWMQVYVSSVAQKLGAHLKDKGSSIGILTYTEEALISRPDGEPLKKVLNFIMTVDREGKATYGSPVLTAADPDVIYATYTPLKPGDGIEEDWSLPNAGTLTYQVLDSRGAPRTTQQVIDVHGAYDGALGDTSGVACLMNRSTSGCLDGGTDILTLMNKHGTDLAIVDYINQLTPVYDERTGEDGEPEYVPRGAITYNDRSWSCKEYTNEGEYGYVLEVRADRYYATLEPDGNIDFMKTEEQSGKALSPVKPFNKSVLASSVPGNPNNYLISPVNGDNSLIGISDNTLQGIIHVAPVRMTASIDFLEKAVVTGAFPLNKYAGDGSFSDFMYGIEGVWSLANGRVHEGTIEFDLDSVDDFEEFTLQSVNYKDWMLMTINGQPAFSAPIKPLIDLRLNTQVSFMEEGNFRCIHGVNDARGPIACGNTWWHEGGWSAPPGLETVCLDPVQGEPYVNCVTTPSFYYHCTYENDGSEGTRYTGTTCNTTPCTGGAMSTGNNPITNRGYPVEYTFPGGTYACGKLQSSAQSVNEVVDLLPFLQKGKNVIKTKVLTGVGGGFWSRFRVKGCGADFNLPSGPAPEVPPEATTSSIIERLEAELKK